jgi:hypothetical protein
VIGAGGVVTVSGATVSNAGQGHAVNAAVDEDTGYLYSLNKNGIINIFADPHTQPRLVGRACGPHHSLGIAINHLNSIRRR